MTKQESHLFCRIAIHNKLVSLEDANECLREALAEGKNVGEVFIGRGLLTAEQARAVLKSVARRKAQASAPQGEGPAGAARAPAGREPGRRGGRRRQNTSQLALTISSLVVLLVVTVLFVYFWRQPRSEPSTQPESPTKTAGAPAASQLAPDLGPEEPGGGGEKALSVMSEEEKEEIERACNDSITDATQSLTTGQIGPVGVASLDNFLKKHGDRASPEQKERVSGQRQRLIDIIKRRYEKDKARLQEAKQKGDAGELLAVRRDIELYADKETMKEVDDLIGGSPK